MVHVIIERPTILTQRLTRRLQPTSTFASLRSPRLSLERYGFKSEALTIRLHRAEGEVYELP
jgi:hypothetical protein